MFIFSDQELVFIFGLLGNIVAFLVFLAPLPTFFAICKRKSSEGYQSVPYVVALLSATLLLYYGFLKSHAILIVTINSIGCVIEITYLILYFIYASRKQRISTLVMLGISQVGGFGATMAISTFAFKGIGRVHAVGWVCATFNIAVFAAPLSIMRTVIKTKSVEFMPFSLSFFLSITAIMWFFYGFFSKDYFIMLPNVLGFLLGVAQMGLYMTYKDANKKNSQGKSELPEWKADVDGDGDLKAIKDTNLQPKTSHLQLNVC